MSTDRQHPPTSPTEDPARAVRASVAESGGSGTVFVAGSDATRPPAPTTPGDGDGEGRTKPTAAPDVARSESAPGTDTSRPAEGEVAHAPDHAESTPRAETRTTAKETSGSARPTDADTTLPSSPAAANRTSTATSPEVTEGEVTEGSPASERTASAEKAAGSWASATPSTRPAVPHAPDSSDGPDGAAAATQATAGRSPRSAATDADSSASVSRAGDIPAHTAVSPADVNMTTPLVVAKPSGGSFQRPPGEEEITTGPLFDEAVVERLRRRWRDVQGGFVDGPRDSVARADQLVAEVIHEFTAACVARKATLDRDWPDGADTEALRHALRGYRAFFDQLLTAPTH